MGDADALSTRAAEDRRGRGSLLWSAVKKAGIARAIASISTYTEEEPFGMTNGRAIAKFLSRFSWYNPQASTAQSAKENGAPPNETDMLLEKTRAGEPRKANLDIAWHHFEHMVLPRRFCTKDGERIAHAADSIKAMPGEVGRPTTLYNPFRTTMAELGDFGIGIGLYFSMLRGLTVVTLIVTLINIPNFLYFSSSEYSSHGQTSVKTLLRGSAICTDTEWVPCPSCARDDGDETLFNELWATSRIASSDDGLLFALKNTCGDGDYLYTRGMVSWVGTIFLVVALLAMGAIQRRLQVQFDERNATATDFSICIKNPPGDATDPDEWKKYLETVASVHLSKEPTSFTPRDTHVTCLTIGLNNYELTDALIARRKLKKTIIDLLGDDGSEKFESWYEEARASSGSSDLGGKLQKLATKLMQADDRIRILETKPYSAKRIFASFETEVGQRAALTALNVAKTTIWRNNVKALKHEQYAFRGRHVVNSFEPTEPLTIRWHDLGVPNKVRIAKRIVTTLLSLLAVLGAFFLIRYVWLTAGAEHTAIFIAILNILTPHVCRGITAFEVHSSEGRKQASHSIKVLGLRCVNSAIIIQMVTPFPLTITNGDHLIKAVCAIFIAEMVTAPLVQVLNIPGFIKMHIVAPRCKDQETMNMMFTGGRWELGERYTNMMKILFLCFFFSAIFPGAFALSALSLFIHYEVDKFCLMRVWARAPSLGGQVAEMNRSYIVPLLLVTLAVMNAYLWSGFPYDNLCETTDGFADDYVGTHTIRLPDETASVTVHAGDTVYHACSQDFLHFPMQFPPLPTFQDEVWMSKGQEAITSLHAWTSIAIIGIAVTYIFFLSELSEAIAAVFRPTYEPSGVIYGIDFSDVPGDIFQAYVPQVTAKGFSFPLIACDIGGISPRFIGWKDEDGDHSEHVLCNDVSPELVNNKERPLFSIMRHWEPPAPTVAEF